MRERERRGSFWEEREREDFKRGRRSVGILWTKPEKRRREGKRKEKEKGIK